MCEPITVALSISADACVSFRHLIFFLFLLKWTRKAALKLKGRGVLGTIIDAYSSIQRTLYGCFLRAPVVRSQVKKQVTETIAKLEGKLVPHGPGISRYLTLPKEGWTEQQISAELSKFGEMEHTRWEDGMVSGAVYHNELVKLQVDAYQKYALSNPIHPEVFPGLYFLVFIHKNKCRPENHNRGQKNGGGNRRDGPVYVQRAAWWSRSHDKWRNRIYPDGLSKCKAKGIRRTRGYRAGDDHPGNLSCRFQESRLVLWDQGTPCSMSRSDLQRPYQVGITPHQ